MDICREKATVLLKQNLYNDAVAYAVMSKDKEFVDYCIDRSKFKRESIFLIRNYSNIKYFMENTFL